MHIALRETILNVTLLLLAPVLTILVESRHRGDVAAVAFRCTLAWGTGIVVILGPVLAERLNMTRAIPMGILGMVVFTMPMSL